MAEGQPRVSPMIVEEAFASGDPRFVEYFIELPYDSVKRPRKPPPTPPEPPVSPRPWASFADHLKTATRIVEKWKRDHRPWARQQLVRYLQHWGRSDWGPDITKARLTIKRFFKHADVTRDDELMAAFMWFFDRQVRRRRVTRWQSIQGLRQPIQEEALRAVARGGHFSGGPFTAHTCYYCRRRAWRYFRRMGFKQPDKYPAAVAAALARYRDEDLKDGDAILDNWGLVHACFGGSDAIDFNATHAKLTRPVQLSEMLTPYFEELWKKPAPARVLLRLASGANSKLVRTWAAQLIRRDHKDHLRDISADELLRLLDHPEEDVQNLGAELLEVASAAGGFDVPTWLRLLQTKSLTALGIIAEAMKRHIRGEQLTLAQMVDLAIAKPVPVARLGLDFLRAAKIETDTHRRELTRLAHAQSEGAGREIAAFALSILGQPQSYDPDTAVRFFDSLNPAVRAGAWDWLTPDSPGWNDTALWSRLIENPYDDIRFNIIRALESRAAARAPAWRVGVEALTALWCSVLLQIHRGGRAKLTALRQITGALTANPDQANLLIPVAAVAIRSVRFPESRAGLAAILSAAAQHPHIEPLVKRHLPELSVELLEGQKVAP